MVPHGARERHVRPLRYILRSRVENFVHLVDRIVPRLEIRSHITYPGIEIIDPALSYARLSEISSEVSNVTVISTMREDIVDFLRWKDSGQCLNARTNVRTIRFLAHVRIDYS